MSELLEAALAYATRDGWAVVPVGGDDHKDPGAILGNGWQQQASADADVIREWDWSRATGLGVYLAASGLVAVDVDKPELREVVEALGVRLDAGLVVQSGRDGGGWHAYYQRPAGLSGEQWGNPKIGGVEVRGNGMQVLPPSVHRTGRRYEWLVQGMEIPPLPEAIVKARTIGGPAADRVADAIPEGERNSTLASLAGSMRHRGMSEAEIMAALTVTNTERCRPPLRVGDVERIAHSIARYDPAPTPMAHDRQTLELVWLDTIQMRSIEWVDKPLWQRRTFHLLAGMKGAGKGTYIALHIAKMTTGKYPGGPQNVIIISTEDSAEIDLKPRIVAAGGDPNKVAIFTRHFKLPNDLDQCQQIVLEVEAARGPVGMLIVDPLSNSIGDRNTNAEAEVREAIAPLNQFAVDLDLLLIGVRHLGKDRGRGALASVLGSTAWVDTPRAVVMIVPDDEDTDIRHIQVVVGNRTKGRAGVMFRIEEASVEGLVEPVTLAVELGASTKDIEDLLNPEEPKPSSKSTKARELLLDLLDEAMPGGWESDTLDAKVAQETGLAAKTIQNLRTELRKAGLIRSSPSLDANGNPECWMVYRTRAGR